MGKCINHPDRETSFLCMKHNTYLCEECLKCQDPNLHCKFRPSCPIWFMEKRGGKSIDELPQPDPAGQHRVVFMPDNKAVFVSNGDTLLTAAVSGEVPLNASCNGKGSCGKCKLILASGDGNVQKTETPLLSDEEKAKNYVLACQTRVFGDVTVRIPEETLEKKLKIAGMGEAETDRLRGLVKDLSPMLRHVPLELSAPTLDDSISDMDRLLRGLSQAGCDVNRMSIGLDVMRQLAEAMRNEDWKVTALVTKKRCSSEIVGVRPGNGTDRSLGLAVDVGTTSIVVYLVDMADGTILAATSGHNRQAACGDDVINRIVCAEKDGVKKLSRMGLATINGLINEAIDSAGVDRGQVDNVALSGNTTMVHLLLQIEPRHIRREPYIPSVSAFPVLKAGNVGLKVNPSAAVFVMPGPASYVGGDIVSGLIYTGFHREDPVTLFIDVGTNGEIVLGNKDWLMTASCSAGPAFEGGGVRWGMRAEEGAVENVVIDRETFVPELKVIGDGPPRGICGSGMIDLISEMHKAGIIQQNGKIQADDSHPRITRDGDEKAYVLVLADETSVGRDILFMESDIDNIIRSKGAVYAGFKVLLNQAGMDFSMVDRIIITGGFGQYLDLDKAVSIGLLPDVGREKFAYMGNSSIAGAYMALLSEPNRQEALEISNNMTYIDFSSNNRFMDEFVSALFLPHTNIEEFPSMQGEI